MEHRYTSVKVASVSPFKKPQQSRSVANTAVASPRSNPLSCISCSEKHLLVQCPTFQRLSVGQRRELIAQKRLCWNCFKSSNVARNCDSRFSCRLCHERHHTLLHQPQASPFPQKGSGTPVVEQPVSSSTCRVVGITILHGFLYTVVPLLLHDEVACDELYQATTTRNADGRCVVALPKSQNPHITLGESRAIAERRLRSLERRLERDEAVEVAYHEFMDEYLRLGHMRRLEDPVDDSLKHYYLPHHPVFKASSTTTKVRVVFDASCRTSSGNSLNDILLVGPVVQEDLQSIEMRFRTKPVGVLADVEKWNRQIGVVHIDRSLIRITFKKDQQIQSPLQLANDEGENFPKAKTFTSTTSSTVTKLQKKPSNFVASSVKCYIPPVFH
ncbi:uncharacterized protein LOC135704951 [Ochlerotatus camptorhynchus]|uniref:uncharacterized protein LOC135704951 n=1 Tax=Ochlerotatus camptorhynchus TaxID=644619 RepID=UPI0031DF100F